MSVCYAHDRAQVDVAIAEIRQDKLTLSLIIDVENPLNERGLAVVPSDFVQRCSLRREGGQLRKVSVQKLSFYIMDGLCRCKLICNLAAFRVTS